MDISKFASNLDALGGPAPVNRFLVNISIPKGMKAADASEKLSLLCESVPLPGVAIGTDDRSNPYGFGPNYKMPWGVIFSDINMVFIGDAKGFVHNFFFTWLNTIVNFNNESVTKITPTHVPYFIAYKEDYATNVNIQALDHLNKRIISYKLFDCFPTLLDDVQGSWGANNQTMRIAVRFNYTRWNISYEKLNEQEYKDLSKIKLNPNGSVNTQLEADRLNTLTGNYPAITSKPKFVEYMQTYKNMIPLISTTDLNY